LSVISTNCTIYFFIYIINSLSGLFIALGLTGVVPAFHFVFIEGFQCAVYEFAFLHLVTMAILYIGGALMYAFRIPESIYPGKFDIWVGSLYLFMLQYWYPPPPPFTKT